MTERKFGWKRDLPDIRDLKYKIVRGVELPKEVDLRKSIYPIVDQGTLGSCTGCGVSNINYAVQHIQNKENKFYPSRLFLYYNTRSLEGTISSDSGATIRNTIKAIAKWGTCSEDMWKYDITKFREKPAQECYIKAEENQAIKYESIPQDLYSLKSVLAEGFPITGGIMLFSSFQSDKVARTGIVPIPNASKEAMLGGHCISIYGHSDSKQCFIGMNSWGTSWGDRGYFYIPYSYLTNKRLAADFWVIKLIE